MPSRTIARPTAKSDSSRGLVRDRAGAARLEVGLLVTHVTEHEVQQGPRGDADEAVVEPAGRQCAGQGVVRRPRAEAERTHRRDQLGPVAVGQHRVAQVGADRGDLDRPVAIGAPTLTAREDLVGDRCQQGLLVLEVVVQRAGLDAELGAEPSHGEVTQAVGVEHRDRVLDDVSPAVGHEVPLVDR